jgi:hypothetical protein
MKGKRWDVWRDIRIWCTVAKKEGIDAPAGKVGGLGA